MTDTKDLVCRLRDTDPDMCSGEYVEELLNEAADMIERLSAPAEYPPRCKHGVWASDFCYQCNPAAPAPYCDCPPSRCLGRKIEGCRWRQMERFGWTPPDAAPAEPVAWIQADHLQKAKAAPFLCRVEPTQRLPDFIPLYAHPAAPAPTITPSDDAAFVNIGGGPSVDLSGAPAPDAATVKDAERYRWLRPRLFAIDFDYPPPQDRENVTERVAVIAFEWPDSIACGCGNALDAAIDAAMKEPK